MKIKLQKEGGQPIGEPVNDDRNVLPKILAAANANQFTQLQHLDLYGDTTFNGSQLEAVVREWAQLMPHAHDADARAFLQAVAELLERGKSELHRYVKFIGD